MKALRLAAAWGAALLLAACTGVVPPPQASAPQHLPVPPQPQSQSSAPAAAAPVESARAAGVRAGPAVATLALAPDRARDSIAAFRRSCAQLTRRSDGSALTQPADWKPACDAAVGWNDGDAARFFATYFETATIGDGRAFATGYYEPDIAGSLIPGPGYQTPIYRRPLDLVEVDLGAFADDLKGRKIRGRVQDGRFVPYYERSEIEAGALAGRGLEIGYAADPIEFFFLQIQGSGRLRLPDGGVLRIGYDGQNGRAYVGIGSLMKSRGMLQPGQSSMQGLMAVLRAQPDAGKSITDENKSFVFFRVLTGDGPVGALGVAVSARTSVAADPHFVPLGAPVWLSLDRPEATGLWIAQDTGGAIKGANRFDTFWGAGEEARTIAGGMSGRGEALLLLPVGTLERLSAAGGNGGAPPSP